MTLDFDDIQAIAKAVVREIGLMSGRDLAKVSDMPLEDQKKYWKSVREDQKRKQRGKTK